MIKYKVSLQVQNRDFIHGAQVVQGEQPIDLGLISIQFGTRLALDWCWIGKAIIDTCVIKLNENLVGFITRLTQVGTETAQDWHPIDAQVMMFGSLLVLDWHQIDNRLAQKWHWQLIYNGLVMDLHSSGFDLTMDWN